MPWVTATSSRCLPRLLGGDVHGILYIGTSSGVANRLGNLRKSVSAAYSTLDPVRYGKLPYTDPGTHQTGRKIVRIGRRFVDFFDYGKLCLTLQRHVPPADAVGGKDYGYFALEDGLLRKYEQTYGERPALNG